MRFLILANLILIVACNSLENKKDECRELTLKITPIEIDIDTLGKYSYDIFTFKNEENLELIAYNGTSHCIEFYDIEAKKLKKRIFFENDGPKAIGEINSLYYYNKDSIFLHSRGVIKIINEEYNNISNINLYTLIEDYNNDYYTTITHYFKIRYLPAIKSIPLSNIYQFNEQIKKDNEQISLFNLKDFTIKSLPFYHTEEILNTIDIGQIGYPTISQVSENNFLVNFIYSPITYLFNYHNKELKIVIDAQGLLHKINKNEENSVRHLVESNIYNSIEKINDSLYVRSIYSATEYYPNEPNFLNKDFILQFYNIDFELVKELTLPKNTYQYYSGFIANNKIYLQAAHPNYDGISEDKLILHEVEIVTQ